MSVDKTKDLEALRARVFGGQGWNKAYVEGALIHDLWAEVERLNAKLDRVDRDIASVEQRAYDEGMREGASEARWQAKQGGDYGSY